MFHYIDLSTVNEGKLNLPSNKIAFREAPSRARRKVKKNDVLLATVRPNLKGFAYISFEANDIVCSTGYAVLRSKNEVISLYLFYNLFSHETERYFYSCVVGSNYPALNNSDVNNLRIPLPPLPEQKKIAEILSAWDRAIEQVGKLIDAKQRLKKGLMQQLLTGRMRFPEFGKPVEKKGKLPVGWKVCKLGACFKERKETNPDLPLLAITSDRGVIPRDEVERKDTSNADKSKYKRIAPGDIGYNTMRMWQGVSAVSTLEGIVSPAYTICTPKKGHSSSFFGYLFKYPAMIHLFHRFSQGLVSDTLNLKFRHFSQVRANVPAEAEQTRIAAVLSTCDREIELLKKKQEKLKEQKKGLMQKLLTGEVRVKVDNGGIYG
jgi:type I restriction enzyme S subunit